MEEQTITKRLPVLTAQSPSHLDMPMLGLPSKEEQITATFSLNIGFLIHFCQNAFYTFTALKKKDIRTDLSAF